MSSMLKPMDPKTGKASDSRRSLNYGLILYIVIVTTVMVMVVHSYFVRGIEIDFVGILSVVMGGGLATSIPYVASKFMDEPDMSL